MTKLLSNSVISHPGFINLWFNQILVQLAYNCLNFSLIIWVYQLTQSNTAVSVLMFAIYLPAVLLGLVAGVLVDLFDRRWIFIIVNLGLTLLFLSLIIFKNNYFAILSIAFLVNTLSQFYTPAEASAIPLIVKKHQLLTANSLFSITLFSTFLIGFGLAGPIIDLFGINYAFGLGGILLFIAFICSWLFPKIISSPTKQSIQLWYSILQMDLSGIWSGTSSQIKQTISLVKNDISISVAIGVMSGIQVVIGIIAVLIPAFLEQVIKVNATNASYFLVLPLGLGMVSGGFWLSRWGHFFSKRFIVGRGIIIAGILFLFAGLAPLFSPAIKYFPYHQPLPFFTQIPLVTFLALGAFVLGVCLVSIMVPSQTIIQEKTPESDRGKVFALLAVAMSSFSLIPVLVAGILADLIGTPTLLAVMGSIIFTLGTFSLKPNIFYKSDLLSQKLKDFLGNGHWQA